MTWDAIAFSFSSILLVPLTLGLLDAAFGVVETWVGRWQEEPVKPEPEPIPEPEPEPKKYQLLYSEHGHVFVVRFTDKTRYDAIKAMLRWANSSEVPFTQWDAHLCSQEIMQREKSGQGVG